MYDADKVVGRFGSQIAVLRPKASELVVVTFALTSVTLVGAPNAGSSVTLLTCRAGLVTVTEVVGWLSAGA